MLQKDTYYLATPLEDPQPFQVAAKLADITDGHPPGHPQHRPHRAALGPYPPRDRSMPVEQS